MITPKKKYILAYTSLRVADIISTLIFYNNGYRELNLLWRTVLTYGTGYFVILNLALSLFVGLLFVRLWEFRVVKTIFKLFLIFNLLIVIVNLLFGINW